MHEVLVNRLGGQSLPRKSVVRLTDRPDMTLDVYCRCKTTTTIFLLGSKVILDFAIFRHTHNRAVCRMKSLPVVIL